MNTFGTIAPKGKTQFIIELGHTTGNDYLAGRVNTTLEHQVVYARNAHEATLIAECLDTKHGTATGWEVLSCKPS